MQTLSLDTSLLTVDPESLPADTSQHIDRAITAVENNIAKNKYGFITELASNVAEEVEAVYEKIQNFSTMVVVGIGGSDLGGRVIKQAFDFENQQKTDRMQVLFHGDSPDPVALDQLLNELKLEETVFVIISKSGQTVETISQYLYLKQTVMQQQQNWASHFVFITDADKGLLRQEADEHGVHTLVIPDSVGGRFSVLTSVGLLPARALGVDIRTLLQGAQAVASDASMRQVAQAIATTQFQLYQAGYKVTICMPYAVQLEEFGRWFRQLWAESLGKDGRGILPIQARGPADQHSQLQFYNQGSDIASVLLLNVLERFSHHQISEVKIPELQYLAGKDFNQILQAEYQATRASLHNAGRSVVSLEMQKLTPEVLGQLFMIFELAVVYLAEMLQVNAFDQPGVEESKQIIYGLLGKPGFEEFADLAK